MGLEGLNPNGFKSGFRGICIFMFQTQIHMGPVWGQEDLNPHNHVSSFSSFKNSKLHELERGVMPS